MPPTRPRPSELQHLRPSNAAAAVAVATAAGATALGIALAIHPFEAPRVGSFDALGLRVLAWVAGQVILGFALVQWFVLQHECGHDTLFASKRLNGFVGAIAGGFAA